MITPEKLKGLLATGNKERISHSLCDVADDIFYEKGPAAVPEALKTVLAVETFYGGIANGGLEQYLSDGHEAFAVFAVEALANVGLDVPSKVLSEALELIPEELKKTENPDYLDCLIEIDDKYGADYLDEKIGQKFWDWYYDGNTEEIRNKLNDWIIANENRFTSEH